VAKILYTQSYIRRARKFAKRHPEMLSQYGKTLRLLEANPAHPSLRLHKLSGTLEGLYRVSINKSFRISLEFLVQEDTIIPVDIGANDEIYRGKV
jgi:mRNA-degrading endonuclease YafQ of YafQ-DinJ toxin-antitoxin module